MIRAFIAACFLLMVACATHDSRWSAYNSANQGFKNTGQIEYNGIGGSGRQADTLPENGLGGSGNTPDINLHQAQANGLGGSGRQAPDIIENGLGGSGKQASGKAAILGPISAFGSIWVNDRHIQLPNSTEYLIAGNNAQRSDLRLGQVVAVLADSLDDSDYQALEVHLMFNVIGKLETIELTESEKGDQQPTKLALMGQTVLIDNDTRIVNHTGERLTQRQLQSGEQIAISGLRMPNQEIKATLLIVQSPHKIQLAGPVSAIDGQYWIGQQKLSFNNQPELDQPIRMHGDLRDGLFVVNDWAPLPHDRIFELADEVWLEGFPLSDAEFFIEGFEVQLPEFTDDLFDPNDSMRIGIDMDDQAFWMDHEPPEDDIQWQQQDDWQQDEGFMRRGPEPEDPEFQNQEFHDQEFRDQEFHDSDFNEPYYEEPGFEDQGFEDQGFDDHDYYLPEQNHHDDYYPDDYYPYDNNPPPRPPQH